jgi:ubiquitin-like 1-activating enzyme E1 B
LTVVDESDEDIFVNVVLGILESYVNRDNLSNRSFAYSLCRKESLDNKPIKGLEPDKAPQIPRRPKKDPAPASISGDQTNGKHKLEADTATKDLKRAREDETDGLSSAKKAKTATLSGGDDVVIIQDGGAILIDD